MRYFLLFMIFMVLFIGLFTLMSIQSDLVQINHTLAVIAYEKLGKQQ